MTEEDLVGKFGLPETAYPTAHGTMKYRTDWLPGAMLTNRTNRGNAPWKNSEHIILADVEQPDFIETVWEEVVKNDLEQPSVQKLYKLNADGSYSMYDSDHPSVKGPVETGPLLKLLLRGILGREIKVSAFARAGFRLIDEKCLWHTEDCAWLTSTASGGQHGLRTKGMAVLKEKKGIPGELQVYGGTRYYADCVVHIEDKDFYLASMFYAASFDPLAEFFLQHGLTMQDILEAIKKELESETMYTGDLGQIQKIVYGAPGTGKSFGTDGQLKDGEGNPKAVTYRMTFHPDSDYSSFVGAYKPAMNDDNKIVYSFRPQAFMDAYVKAWRIAAGLEGGKPLPVVLIIEEINRGNCAQVFGDLFQLLDRDDGSGYSKYPITADVDLAKWLSGGKQFGAGLTGIAKPATIKQVDWDLIVKGKMLALPPNLYIWATMNTSDQSLFPMDSAFKRRWDWKYVPISKPTGAGFKDRKIVANGFEYDWWDFITIINGRIAERTKSEDKQLGYFFVKAPSDTGLITAERFASKVLFYLYNDVFKDWDLPADIFGRASNGKFSFKDFFYDTVTIVDGREYQPGDVKEAVVAEFLEHQEFSGKKILKSNSGGGAGGVGSAAEAAAGGNSAE